MFPLVVFAVIVGSRIVWAIACLLRQLQSVMFVFMERYIEAERHFKTLEKNDDTDADCFCLDIIIEYFL